MSLVVKIIGIIIMVLGTLAVFGTMYAVTMEQSELSMSEALSADRFLSNIIKYVGQTIVILIGIGVYVIGIKLEHRHS